ncbi:MAG: PAS domain-containing protein, partial [Pseudomonadota bacterium]|nr:PAS domain-containing protein [Pseudomonadota bacterium]
MDFQALFDASPAPLVVLAAADFAIMAANDAYLRASMTVRTDILGRTPFDVFPANPGDPAASGARELRASLERVLATRRTDALAMHRWDIPRPEAAGGGFEERWWSIINTPVLDPSGQLSSILMRIEDVTMLVTRQGDSAVRDQIARDQQDVIERLREANTALAREDATRRRVEADLRASEERFRTLATSLPQLVFRSLGTGDRSWPSPQWQVYAGQSDAESRGYGWLEAVHPDDRAATLEAWGRAGTTGDEYYCEHRIRRAADGAYRWHQTRAVPLRDDRGGITEWVGSSADVDDMR